jgi:hypothetical protein
MVVMSTRCQVKVVGEGLGWEDAEPITLYHHSDGYPSYMLPIIRQGFELAVKKNTEYSRRYGITTDHYLMETGQPSKAASFLCAADPGNFEPEAGHELHGDIEWYYVLRCINKVKTVNGKQRQDKPEWRVDIYQPPEWDDISIEQRQSGARHQFWQNPRFEDLHIVERNVLVSKGTQSALKKKGKKIEDRLNREYEETHPQRMQEFQSMMKKAKAVKSMPLHRAPGWHREPARHSLAARGVRTRRKW